MGLLGTTVPGRAIIRFMGHANPPPSVAVTQANQRFPSPCGLACGVDLSAQAVSAISLFGFGLIEVGPVGCHTTHPPDTDATHWRGTALAIPNAVVAGSVAELSTRLQTNAFRNGVTVVARLALVEDMTPAQIDKVCKHLDDSLDGYSVPLDLDHPDTTGAFLQALNNDHRLLLGIVTPQQLQESGSNLAAFLDQSLLDGVIIEGGIDSSGQRGLVGVEVIEQIIKAVRSVAVDDREWLLITSGGIEQPVDAMELLDAGADLVLVDSGFATAGPGIPKRINNNVQASQRIPALKTQCPDDTPFGHRSWFWSFLLGLSLTMGGIAAVILGWTRVLLPYDEEFLGMLRDEICGINDQLLPFMSHDRVTLAGTMLSLGPLYLALAWFGDRRGMHWARSVVLTSAFTGFLSFFLFLGFGYFDPFHAFIAAILFQFITLCFHSTQQQNYVAEFDLHNSAT